MECLHHQLSNARGAAQGRHLGADEILVDARDGECALLLLLLPRAGLLLRPALLLQQPQRRLLLRLLPRALRLPLPVLRGAAAALLSHLHKQFAGNPSVVFRDGSL